MSYSKSDFLYEGKAKRLYKVEGHDDLLWIEYKDSLTAFNALKKSSFAGKGIVNAKICIKAFESLKAKGVGNHIVRVVSDREWVVQKLEMIPLEVVVRNRVAGSLFKRLQFEEGHVLETPIVEFYLKDDEKGDPLLTDSHIRAMNIVSDEKLEELKVFGFKVNAILTEFWKTAELDLVDFKIECGFDKDQNIMLGDEISPDSCRLWDQATGKKMDKDVFRFDLGSVEESYNQILERLNK